MRGVIIGGIAFAVIVATAIITPPGGPLSANVWVGANGSCVRAAVPIPYDPSRSCGSSQSWMQAYTAAQSGDTVGVETGNYVAQVISKDAAKGTAGPDVTFKPGNGVVVITGGPGSNNNALSIGGTCKCSSTPPPNHLAFDGGTSKNFHTGSATQFGQIKVYPGYDSTPANDILPDHITFRNLMVAVGSPDPGVGSIELASDTNTVIDNVQVGPICCGLNMAGGDNGSPTLVLVGHRDEGASTHQTTNLTITNSFFAGETMCGVAGGANPNCTHADWPSALGAPPQANCSSPNNCHADCFHFTGVDGLVFKHNIAVNCRAQALFFENQNSGITRNVTVIDNYLGSLGSCSFCLGGTQGQVSTTQGTLIFAFNTGNAGMGYDGPSTFGPSGSITMIGNVGGIGNHGNDTSNVGCNFQPAGWTVNFSYNVWTNLNSTDVALCNTLGAGNIVSNTYPTLPVVHQNDWSATPSDNNVSYDLAAGTQPPDNLVPSASCTPYTTQDVHGTTRPQGANCDAGGNER